MLALVALQYRHLCPEGLPNEWPLWLHSTPSTRTEHRNKVPPRFPSSIKSAPRSAQATPPTIFGGFVLLRAVLLRERIDLVHAHGAFSAIAHEAIIHARTMGYKVGRAHS